MPTWMRAIFINVAKHESKCAPNTATATTQFHAHIAVGSVSSWLNEGPHWNIITNTTATRLVQRGTRLTQELRGKMPGEIMSLMAGYQKKGLMSSVLEVQNDANYHDSQPSPEYQTRQTFEGESFQ